MQWKGFPLKTSENDLEFIQSLEVDSFFQWVSNLREQQFNYFSNYNSFFNAFLSSGGAKYTFDQTPIITKGVIQKPLKELISVPYIGKSVFINNTSGSSGTPFIFAKDKFAHAMTWALIRDRYRWYGIEYGRSLQARFYGIPLHGTNYYKEKLKDYLAARIRFPVFDLSDEKLWNFIRLFKKNPFEYLNGYTSSLVYFADFCIANNIVLKLLCPTLKVCFATSEMCSKEDRKILETGFGIPVAVEYGCAEMDVIAFEDKDGDLLVSNENVYLEIVDEQGVPVPDGNEGRIILTSLYNKAIPLYRYEIGDIGVVRPGRKGKYQVLDRLIGRTNEFAILPSGRKVPALTFYYITKTLIKESSRVKEFVIIQESPRRFRFEYVSDEELSPVMKQSIEKAMDNYLESDLSAIFERKSTIERGKTGKLKQFRRNF